jgi:protein SCO1
MKTNKIIILTVFVCTALMSSLFIFHLRSQPIRTTLSNDAGMIFPIARDIKPFSLVSSEEQPFKLQNFYDHWTLVFFGFTHCSQICPTTLDMIQKAYPELHAAYPNLQVVLISVDPERDTPALIKQYTQTYNKDFLGASGKINELRKLQSQLGIYSERDPNGTNTEYQINHTSSVLLINPQGKWSGLFKFGLSPAQFSQAFKESMQALSNA